MQDRPTAQELLRAVRGFLEKHAMSELEGRSAFHARVAANAVAIVERELEIGPEANAEELDGLRRLLGSDGSLDELNRELCRRIRAREIDAAAPELADHLRSTTLTKLAIDQPKYSAYRRAVEGGKSP